MWPLTRNDLQLDAADYQVLQGVDEYTLSKKTVEILFSARDFSAIVAGELWREKGYRVRFVSDGGVYFIKPVGDFLLLSPAGFARYRARRRLYRQILPVVRQR